MKILKYTELTKELKLAQFVSIITRSKDTETGQ